MARTAKNPKPEYRIGTQFEAKQPASTEMPHHDQRLTIIGKITKHLYALRTSSGKETDAHRDWLYSYWTPVFIPELPEGICCDDWQRRIAHYPTNEFRFCPWCGQEF